MITREGWLVDLDSYPVIGGQYLLDAGPSDRGWHHMATALTCPQLYAYTYILKLDRVEGDALIRGSLVHIGCAHYYARCYARQEGFDPDIFLPPDAAIEALAERMGGRWHQLVQLAQQAVEAYMAWYRLDTFKVVAVEHQMKAHIPKEGAWWAASDADPILYTQRPDLVITDRAGRFWIVDHKCLPSSTRILTDRGPATVEELGTWGDWTCAAWDEERRRVEWATACEPVSAGIQDVYQIRLSDGTLERYGQTHPLLTEKGWKEASEVQVGDWVAVAPAPLGSLRYPTEKFLYLLGLAIADGGRNPKGDGVVITAHDAEVRKHILAAASGEPHAEQAQGVRLGAESSVSAFMRTYRLSSCYAEEKRLAAPFWALGDIDQVGALLGGLWEGDGSASLGTPSKSGKRPLRLTYSSRSLALVQGVRHLLSQLGIWSNLCTTTAAGKPYYQATVVGRESKALFLDLALAGVIRCPAAVAGGRLTRSKRRLEGFDELKEALESTAPSHADPRKRYHGSGRLKEPQLEQGVRWVKVTSTLFTGREECFDVTVEPHHTFLTADCVVTHNTAGRFTKRTSRGYVRSGQMQGYQLFGRHAYGERFGGVILNYLVIQDRKRSEPEFEFHRLIADVKPWRVAAHIDTIQYGEAMIQQLLDSGRDPWRWPKVGLETAGCEHRYGECPFASYCDYGPDGAPEDRD